MNFFNPTNIILACVAAVSGFLLLLPLFQQRGSKVSIAQATQLFNQGKTLFLDVRDETEFATGHVREARNIPQKLLADKLGELAKFKAKTVVVMCATGVRASKAAGQLKAAGFETVHILEGGVTAWQSQGMPLVK